MKNTSRLTAVLLCLVLCMIGVFAFSACSPEQVDFSLSFEADGEKYATVTTAGAEAITLPEDPSKDGYTRPACRRQDWRRWASGVCREPSGRYTIVRT